MSIKEPYITLVQPKNNLGRPHYWVRFLKGNGKQQKAEAQFRFYYTPRKKKIALLEAKAWRDAKRVELGRPLDGSVHSRPSTLKNKVRPDCHNATGVVGVCVHERENLSSTYHFFQVNWMQTVEGKRITGRKTLQYKPEIVGDRERVFELAKKLRRRMVKRHYIK